MINSPSDTHSLLVKALQSGDDNAFGELYDAYSPLLYGLILRIVKDQKEAENLLQDCFIKIWHNISTYSPERGRIATWLINIARNTAIDFTRSRYFNQKLLNQPNDFLVNNEQFHTLAQPQVETVGLRQLVEKLSPGCRHVIEWMYFEGYTQQEISDKFEIPLGTVKSRTRLAMQELRSFYD